MTSVTKPMALDETLQQTNTILRGLSSLEYAVRAEAAKEDAEDAQTAAVAAKTAAETAASTATSKAAEAKGYRDEAAAIVTPEGLSAEVLALKEDAKKQLLDRSKTMYDIFTSSSGNILDVGHYIKGIELADSSSTPFIADSKALCSPFIPVESLQGQSITISGYTPVGLLLMFLKDSFFEVSNFITGYFLTGTSRVLTVPSNAKYAVVQFRKTGASTEAYDFSTMKLSKTGTATNDAFVPVFFKSLTLEQKILSVVEDKDITFTSSSKNVLDTTNVVKDIRITDDYPYFVAAEGCVTSHPIPVSDITSFTFRSNNYSPFDRWIAFSTNALLDASGVIQISRVVTDISMQTRDTTIQVPSGAKFARIVLKVLNGGNNWINDTIAYGNAGTSESFVKESIVCVTVGNKTYPIKTIGETSYDKVKEYERNRVLSELIPYSVTTPSDQISFDNSTNTCNILYFTDSHLDINPTFSTQNASDTIDFVNNCPVALSAVCHAGDIVTGSGVTSVSSFKTQVSKFFTIAKKSTVPFLFAMGNHDGNDWSNTPSNVPTDTDWGDIWYDWAETNYGIVRQTRASTEKSTWHYYDINSAKIRVIAVNCQDTDKTVEDSDGKVKYYGGQAWYISNEQMGWIVNTALNFDSKAEKDWGVIVVIHQDKGYNTSLSPAYESAIQKLLLVCKAFNTQSTYTNSYTYPTDTFYNLEINANFTRYASEANKPHMICWLIGHEHVDINNVDNGINMIYTANGSATMNASDARLARIAGTTTQNCFDILSIDTKHRKIRLIRYGAGKNCYSHGGSRFLENGLSY